MMRAPDLAAIHAAELKVAQGRLNTRASLARARLATREKLARPSTLLLIAASAGVLAYTFAPRTQPVAAPAPDGVTAVAAKTSAIGLVLAFIVRYGMQHLPNVLQHFWTAQQERAAKIRREQASLSGSEFAGGLRH